MSGVVLAGGAGRRMGVDKATLVVEGETLLARAMRRLADAGADPIVVASGRCGRLGLLPWPEVDDGAHAGAGPLAGLLAALQASATELVAVLAVDLPDADPAVFRWLRSQWRPGDAVLVPIDVDGRAQPLHGLVAATPAIAQEVGRHLDAGERRVQRVLASCGVRSLPVPGEVARPGWSRNWNRPDERPSPGTDGVHPGSPGDRS